jgi:hypothetical protein
MSLVNTIQANNPNKKLVKHLRKFHLTPKAFKVLQRKKGYLPAREIMDPPVGVCPGQVSCVIFGL